jgi:glycosyltransferase involved in cell wall biosynthesis
MAVIGLDFTPAYEQGGGIGRYVRELTHALAEHVQFSYRLFVSGVPRGTPGEPPAPNMSWAATPVTPAWLARLWHRARIPFPIQGFTGHLDLYHATDFTLPPVWPHIPTVLTVHDLSFVRVPEAASPSLRAYLNRVVPRSVARASHILADSEATRQDILTLYGTPAEKVTVLYSGVDARFRRVADAAELAAIRMRYHLPDKPLLISVGTVQPRKNYSRLIEALASVRRRGLDVDLLIVGGKGWLDGPIYETLRSTQMEPHVHFTGFAREDDLPALYSLASATVLPSLYEGFGLPVLESMACGTPVVTSNVSSLPEVAGTAGLLVDPLNTDDIAHAIERVLTEDSLRERLSSDGFARAKDFSWSRSAAQLVELYTRLLAREHQRSDG